VWEFTTKVTKTTKAGGKKGENEDAWVSDGTVLDRRQEGIFFVFFVNFVVSRVGCIT